MTKGTLNVANVLPHTNGSPDRAASADATCNQAAFMALLAGVLAPMHPTHGAPSQSAISPGAAATASLVTAIDAVAVCTRPSAPTIAAPLAAGERATLATSPEAGQRRRLAGRDTQRAVAMLDPLDTPKSADLPPSKTRGVATTVAPVHRSVELSHVSAGLGMIPPAPLADKGAPHHTGSPTATSAVAEVTEWQPTVEATPETAIQAIASGDVFIVPGAIRPSAGSDTKLIISPTVPDTTAPPRSKAASPDVPRAEHRLTAAIRGFTAVDHAARAPQTSADGQVRPGLADILTQRATNGVEMSSVQAGTLNDRARLSAVASRLEPRLRAVPSAEAQANLLRSDHPKIQATAQGPRPHASLDAADGMTRATNGVEMSSAQAGTLNDRARLSAVASRLEPRLRAVPPAEAQANLLQSDHPKMQAIAQGPRPHAFLDAADGTTQSPPRAVPELAVIGKKDAVAPGKADAAKRPDHAGETRSQSLQASDTTSTTHGDPMPANLAAHEATIIEVRKAHQDEAPAGIEKMRILHLDPRGESVRRVHIEVDPPELGRCELELILRDGSVRAVVIADRPETVAALRQAETQVRAALATQDILVSHFDVRHGMAGSGGQASEHHQPLPTPHIGSRPLRPAGEHVPTSHPLSSSARSTALCVDLVA